MSLVSALQNVFCYVGQRAETQRTFAESVSLATEIARLVEFVSTEVRFEMPKAPGLLLNVRDLTIYRGERRNWSKELCQFFVF